MKNIHLSIVIPVLNLWDMTAGCLRSIRECTPGRFYEVLVVDNGSTDATRSQCPVLGHELFGDRFHYLRMEDNINFGPACNAGAAESSGEYVFFLNNDTLLDKGWFGPLLEVFKKDPNVMAASPLCLFPDNGRIQYLGIGYSGSLGVRHPYFMFPGNHPVVRSRHRFQALSAAALMVPTAVFRRLGGFFPEYANGFEDMDLCCRMRRAGGRLVQENRSVIFHWASKTPGRNRFDSENMRLINERCAGCFKPDLHRIALQDGFRCELTPWLEMVMHERQGNDLDRLDNLSGEDEIRYALDEHPLWEDGYERLSALLAEQGAAGEAADILYYGAIQFPDPGRFLRLERLALEAGRNEWAAQASAKYAAISRALASPQSLRLKAENVLDWAREVGDMELQALYVSWLKAGAE